MTSVPKRCDGTRRDGQPCAALAITGSAYCFAHAPERTDERDAARRRGGENSAKLVRLRGLVPPRLLRVYDALEDALAEVHDGVLDARRATAVAAIARALVSVLQAGELEERVRRLESGGGADAA